MKQFWDNHITEQSEKFMYSFCQKTNCIVIGGWATYLHTRSLKSKDLDIIIDYNEFSKIIQEFQIKKNERLQKYEINIIEQGFDVDIYIPEYSNIGFDLNFILDNYTTINGIKIPQIEELLTMKLIAYNDRKGSTKGEKDIRDIISILNFTNIDIKRLKNILKYAKLDIIKILKELLLSLKELSDLDINQYYYKKNIKDKYFNKL